MKIYKIIVDSKPLVPNCPLYKLFSGKCRIDNKKCFDKVFSDRCPIEVEK